MKRTALTLALATFLATPLTAQWLGMPTWHSPKGGTGVTFYGDYGSPSDSSGGGDAFGGRASLGLGTITLTAGVASWKPAALNDRVTSYGSTAAFRLIGGSLIPVSVDLQLGAARSAEVTSGVSTFPGQTSVTGSVGFSVPLPTPGIRIEPYFSPGIRYHHLSNVTAPTPNHQTNFGWVIGGNFSFGLVGVHLAYDSEKLDDGTTQKVLGLGANVGLRLPMGL